MDRLVESSKSNFAGMFPSTDIQVWNDTIDIRPLKKDHRFFVSMKECDFYSYLMQQYLMEIDFEQHLKKHKPLIDMLKNNSGMEIRHIHDITVLYDTLQTERRAGKMYV